MDGVCERCVWECDARQGPVRWRGAWVEGRRGRERVWRVRRDHWRARFARARVRLSAGFSEEDVSDVCLLAMAGSCLHGCVLGFGVWGWCFCFVFVLLLKQLLVLVLVLMVARHWCCSDAPCVVLVVVVVVDGAGAAAGDHDSDGASDHDGTVLVLMRINHRHHGPTSRTCESDACSLADAIHQIQDRKALHRSSTAYPPPGPDHLRQDRSLGR